MVDSIHGVIRASTQVALLGEVIPSLRGAAYEIDPNGEVILYFFHDGEITEGIRDHYSCIETEASTGYYHSDKHYSSSYKVIRCDYPKPMPKELEYWIYRRAEPFVDPK